MTINAETLIKLTAQFNDSRQRQKAADIRDDETSDAEYESCREEQSMLLKMIAAIAPAAMFEIVGESGGDVAATFAHVDRRNAQIAAGTAAADILAYDAMELAANIECARDWFQPAGA